MSSGESLAVAVPLGRRKGRPGQLISGHGIHNSDGC